MEREILYMLGIVSVGFAVNYTLRALPFLLFAGKDRELPAWVLRFGSVLSPVIIACLIVYSYSGLAWKTAWPYLAGMITIGLQLWRKNALLSIVIGTVLYMFLLSGCTTVREINYGLDHPLLELNSAGLKFDGKYVDPEDVPDLLEEYRIPHDAVIHIAITPEIQHDLRGGRRFMGFLAANGYVRSVLVTSLHGASELKRDPVSVRGDFVPVKTVRPKVRYKGANE